MVFEKNENNKVYQHDVEIMINSKWLKAHEYQSWAFNDFINKCRKNSSIVELYYSSLNKQNHIKIPNEHDDYTFSIKKKDDKIQILNNKISIII